MSQTFDVAIIGGGPGGSATALSLRAREPSLSILLIEASRYQRVGVGETLPPPTRTMLEHLGVWDSFSKQKHREVFSTTALWGTDLPLDNDFIFMPANTGWLLDRAIFDSMLATEAEHRGVCLMLDTRFCEAQSTDKEWRLDLSTGTTVSARFIVDATGSAAFAKRQGTCFVNRDTLVGVAGFFDDDNEDPRVVVEAFENGWWYTAGLPDRRRIVVCMTDADLARQFSLNHDEPWNRTLANSSKVGTMVKGNRPLGSLVVRSANSRRLNYPGGQDWLAVGDSASRFDPLSSQGIAKALRSGIFASYAIGDWLIHGDDSGLQRYHRYVGDEFKSYLEVRRKYYCEEQRWPASEFWRRRHISQGGSAVRYAEGLRPSEKRPITLGLSPTEKELAYGKA